MSPSRIFSLFKSKVLNAVSQYNVDLKDYLCSFNMHTLFNWYPIWRQNFVIRAKFLHHKPFRGVLKSS